ncbi:MAG: exodeoxyribonuclease I [bacterium]|jgi:exodeoxyribonuclease-1
MKETLFFYDLETSGISSTDAQIVQFAGQRTDTNFNLIGDPVNVLIKPLADRLPAPDAVLVHGITPQKAMEEGLSESEFLKYFHKEIVQENTTFVGFNSIRFDDEFMRNINYRNFWDPYEWQWDNGNSRWDILDLSRQTRALRPEDIEWPFNDKGEPSNKLELIASANNLIHENAHDALSDVLATIAVAKMIQDKQPKLVEYQFGNRTKNRVNYFLDNNKNFVYTSGRVPKEFLHTTIMSSLVRLDSRNLLAYDLRHDPTEFINMSVEELAEGLRPSRDQEKKKVPVKTIQLNKCPALAPLSLAKDEAVQERIQLTYDDAYENYKKLVSNQGDFTAKLMSAMDIIEKEKKVQYAERDAKLSADQKIYSGFIGVSDQAQLSKIRNSNPEQITDYESRVRDPRLKDMLPLYKARNYPKSLTSEEAQAFEEYCANKLLDGGDSSQAAKFFKRLGELAAKEGMTLEQDYLLQELKLYAESILPVDVDG